MVMADMSWSIIVNTIEGTLRIWRWDLNTVTADSLSRCCTTRTRLRTRRGTTCFVRRLGTLTVYASLLECLHTELHKKNIELFGLSMVPGFRQESSKLIGSFKRVLSMGRTQNEAATNRKSNGTSLTTVGEEEKQSSPIKSSPSSRKKYNRQTSSSSVCKRFQFSHIW